MFSAAGPDSAFPAARQQIISWIVQRRVHVSSIVFLLLVGEDIVTGFTPHDLTNFRDAESVLGLGFVSIGLALRSWAAGILQKNSKLTTMGPYALIRNPLYVGSFSMMVGFCTLIDEPENWIVLSLFLPLFIYTVRHEECILAERFGPPWDEYAKSTPRFIPRQVTAAIAGTWRLQQWIVNREYQAVSAATLGLIALQAWQMI